MNKFKCLLSLVLLSSMIVGCSKQESTKIELSTSSLQLYEVEELPLYDYTTEEEFEAIKEIEPHDLSNYRGFYTELTDLVPFTSTLYVLQEGEYQILNEFHYEIELPIRDGNYILTVKTNDHTSAAHFIVGDGMYRESEDLTIFSENSIDKDETILLSTDNYDYEYHVYIFLEYFNSMLITKENTGGSFFNDFDYRVYDDYFANKESYDEAQFRNGNEIHYHNEVYYVSKIYNAETPGKEEILSVNPIKLSSILNNEEIQEIRVMQPANSETGKTAMSLSNSEQEALLNELLSANYYETTPLIIGAGGIEHSIEIVTNQHTYSLRDDSGSMFICIDEDSNYQIYNANFRIKGLLEELGII